MALPLLAVVGLGLFGAKKAYDAHQDNKEAERLHYKAKSVFETANAALESSRNSAHLKFEELGAVKSKVIETTLNQYATLVDKADVHDTIIQSNVIAHVGDVRNSITKIRKTLSNNIKALDESQSLPVGVSIIGGIIAAPIILVAEILFGNAAEKRKYDAQAYYNTVRSAAECIKNEANLWNHAKNRTTEMIETIITLDIELKELIAEVLSIVKRNSNFFMRLFGLWNRKGSRGYEVSRWSKDEQIRLQALMQSAETLTNIINSPILSPNDSTTKKIIALQRECKDLMDEIQKRWGK